jgi:hypothetical protein
MQKFVGLGACVLAAAWWLAPTTPAHAQQACVNNSSGAAKIVPAGTTSCGNNETLTALGGLQAAADFQCVSVPGVTSAGTPFTFQSGVSFGSAISVSGASFTSITLQTGVYQLHFDGVAFYSSSTPPPLIPVPTPFVITATFNASTSVAVWSSTASGQTAPAIATNPTDVPGGDRLVSVTTPNTILTITASAHLLNLVNAGTGCHLVTTKLQ